MKKKSPASRRPGTRRETPAPQAGSTGRSLSKAQIRHLRSLAHALKPVVRLGSQGLTTGVRRELDFALLRHELVKVKLAAETREARAAQLDSLTQDAGATVIQSIGSTAVVYRRNRQQPKILFEDERPA